MIQYNLPYCELPNGFIEIHLCTGSTSRGAIKLASNYLPTIHYGYYSNYECHGPHRGLSIVQYI